MTLELSNKIYLCKHELAGPIGRSPAEIVGSKPTGGMKVCLFCVCVYVMCCQVEVSATGWSLVQSSPTDCGVSLCVI
jgi:hypothetical protein